MGISFTAVDFETANSDRSSVCAVGAVKVVDGRIVETFKSLVQPPDESGVFNAINVSIHGIRSQDVANAATWPEAYKRLMRLAGDDVLVGHNAAFDISVLLNACSVMDIDWPEINSFCTMQLARSTLSISSYSLPWVVDHLGIEVLDHHDPLNDAIMSAEVLLDVASRLGATSFDQLEGKTGVSRRPTIQDVVEPVVLAAESTADELLGEGFVGQVVCFTGGLKSMVRDTARELVVESGGSWQKGVTKTTTILVTGDFDSSTFRPGAQFSEKMRKALAASASGRRLEIITEDQFVTRLSVTEEAFAARLSELGGTKSRAPEYVILQATSDSDADYWEWLRKSLASPLGRAQGGESCIWCSARIKPKVHWIYRDRHVCSGGCNERLKRSAKRAWVRSGVSVPPMD